MNKSLINLFLCIVFGMTYFITTAITVTVLGTQYASLYISFSQATEAYTQPIYILPLILLAIGFPSVMIAFSKEQYLFAAGKNDKLIVKILDSVILSSIYSLFTTSGFVYFLYSQFSIQLTVSSFIITFLAIVTSFAGLIISGNMYATFKK